MSDPAWKKAERRAAKFFGAIRNRLSGGSGRDDCTRSDSTHEFLFIETKHRKGGFGLTNLWKEVRDQARKEDKTPVVCAFEKGKQGFGVVCHSSDLMTVANHHEQAIKNGFKD